jgi:membrane associated rhomboid family serine protease
MPAVRGRAPSSMSYSFGPGPATPAVRWLLIATIGAFAVQLAASIVIGPRALDPLVDVIITWLGLRPASVIQQFYVWQPVTYLFLHAGILHLLFNMLALWMFGVDLERRWGRVAFFRYYFVCGVGAGLTCILASFLPLGFADTIYLTPTVGASGAIYGLILAYAMLFPTRTIYYLIFPVPVRIYAIIVGVLVLLQSFSGSGGVAHFAHLGGLVFGYLYLSLGSGGPWAEIKYRYVKWRMNRMRKRFGVHEGGRRWDSRVH